MPDVSMLLALHKATSVLFQVQFVHVQTFLLRMANSAALLHFQAISYSQGRVYDAYTAADLLSLI